MTSLSIDYRKIIAALPGLHLIIAPASQDFRIIEATQDFAQATQKSRHQIIGRPVFDVFPNHPGELHAGGACPFCESLLRVMESRKPDKLTVKGHWWGLFSQDTLIGQEYCHAVNIPVLDDQGNIECIIHSIEPVTVLEQVRYKESEQQALATALNASRKAALNLMNDALESQKNLEKAYSELQKEIIERKLAEEKLASALAVAEEGRNILDSLMEHIPMGIIVAEAPSMKIRKISKYTYELLGNTFEEIAGIAEELPENWGIFYNGKVIPASVEELPLTRATLKGEIVINEEWVLKRKDGALVHILCNAAPILNSDFQITGGVAGWQDITHQRNARLALQQSEEKFRTLANAIPQLAWIAKPGGEITWFNKRWYQYTGTTSEQMQNQGWKMLHDPVVLPQVLKRWWQSIKHSKPFDMEFPLRGADGVFRPFLTKIMPLKDPEGKVIQWFGTNTDISEQKHHEEQLAIRARELEVANKDLESFSYLISHDLRTPLIAMRGFTSILLEEFKDAMGTEGLDYLQRIIGATDRMSELIDDILNLSRVTRLEMIPTDVCLKDLAIPVISALRASDSTRNVEVILGHNLQAWGDQRLLGHLMANLIENAWKYTGRTNHARIEFGSFAEKCQTVFFVRDNGVGFDMKYANKLFMPFKRLHSEKEFPGTGVGLSIARRVIEKHNGKIWAESQPGIMTTFYFTLPVRKNA